MPVISNREKKKKNNKKEGISRTRVVTIFALLKGEGRQRIIVITVTVAVAVAVAADSHPADTAYIARVQAHTAFSHSLAGCMRIFGFPAAVAAVAVAVVVVVVMARARLMSLACWGVPRRGICVGRGGQGSACHRCCRRRGRCRSLGGSWWCCCAIGLTSGGLGRAGRRGGVQERKAGGGSRLGAP